MGIKVDEFRAAICRRAICMELGGFRPSDNPMASWFGRVGLSLPGEVWPTSDGQPMHALCQLNLTESPFHPPRLEDLEFITVFVGPNRLPTDAANGTNWCLRGYHRLDRLVPLETCNSCSPIKPLPMRPRIIDEDFPCREDVPCTIPEDVEASYHDLFQNVSGFKLGGWPTLIQSEIYWAPWQKHPIFPEYVFQIDSTEKGKWMWGDHGVGYFGRGTAPGKQGEWALEWQCY